jgi:microcystin degradation protein MlrC
MRIAVGGIAHETNTFVEGVTPIEEFQRREWAVGEEMIEKYRGTRTYVGGVIEGCERNGFEIAPAFYATTTPSATIAREAFEEMEDLLLQKLAELGDIDGVVLTLHGAGVAEGIEDIESHIIRRVREHYGPNMPITVTLDLHGNIFPESAEYADVLFGTNFFPHTDMFERGIEAVEMIPRIKSGEVRPTAHLTQLPMILPAAPTDLAPAKDINELCWAWEEQADVIDCTFFHGFGRSDLSWLGVSVVATTNDDPEKAKRISEEIARTVWERREDFRLPWTPPEEAFRQAMEDDGRPVVINERSDNPGGGTPGDGTYLLRAMLDAGLQEACFGFIADPETVQQAHDAGVGSTIQIRLGGKTDDLHGDPIETTAYVKCLTDGQFIQQSPMGRGNRVNLGLMARLVIGGVDVIVSSIRQQTFDDEVFRLHGIDVTRYKIVALKGTGHFRAGFAPIAHKIIRADTPGLSADVPIFPFQNLKQPLWPLDEEVTWP